MISFAQNEHKSGIIRLWQEAFGDSQEVICEFLDNICRDKVIIHTQNNEVLGMATLLPVSCRSRKGGYVYAVATDKMHRGQGICRRLMGFIDDYAKKTGKSFLILVPAKESLFDFYEKMGYNHKVFVPKTFAEEAEKEISPKEYYQIRKEILKDFDLIEWSEGDLEVILSHGKAVKTKSGAAYFENGQAVEVLNDKISKAETKPYALIKYTDDFKLEKPYFGLAMS